MFQSSRSRFGHKGVLSLFLLFISLVNRLTVEGCTCIDRGLHQSYFNKDKNIMKVRVLGKVWDGKKKDMNRKRVHIAKVELFALVFSKVKT